jgi:hypothetical protein
VLSRIRRRLTFANIVALVALVLAAGGGGYAVGASGSGGIIRACVSQDGTLHLQQGRRCGRGERSLSWNQRGATGAPGRAGTPGRNGAPGRDGRNGATMLITRTQTNMIGMNGGATATLLCDPGEVAVGGGAARSDPNSTVDADTIYVNKPGVRTSPSSGRAAQPGETPNAWIVGIKNGGPAVDSFTFYVVCAAP